MIDVFVVEVQIAVAVLILPGDSLAPRQSSERRLCGDRRQPAIKIPILSGIENTVIVSVLEDVEGPIPVEILPSLLQDEDEGRIRRAGERGAADRARVSPASGAGCGRIDGVRHAPVPLQVSKGGQPCLRRKRAAVIGVTGAEEEEGSADHPGPKLEHHGDAGVACATSDRNVRPRGTGGFAPFDKREARHHSGECEKGQSG